MEITTKARITTFFLSKLYHNYFYKQKSKLPKFDLLVSVFLIITPNSRDTVFIYYFSRATNFIIKSPAYKKVFAGIFC